MYLNGFYVGGPFNCSLSLPHMNVSDSEQEKTQADKEAKRHGEKQKHKPPPRTAYLISQLLFRWHFSLYKRKPFYAFGAFILDVCRFWKLSLESVACLVSLFFSPRSREGLLPAFYHFYWILVHRKETHFIYSWRAEDSGWGRRFCAMQRAVWSSGEICWKCLENSWPFSPWRAPSIIGLAVSLCSHAATLSKHKSLLPSPILLLLQTWWLPVLPYTSTALHLPSSILSCSPFISVAPPASLTPPDFSPSSPTFGLPLDLFLHSPAPVRAHIVFDSAAQLFFSLLSSSTLLSSSIRWCLCPSSSSSSSSTLNLSHIPVNPPFLVLSLRLHLSLFFPAPSLQTYLHTPSFRLNFSSSSPPPSSPSHSHSLTSSSFPCKSTSPLSFRLTYQRDWRVSVLILVDALC